MSEELSESSSQMPQAQKTPETFFMHSDKRRDPRRALLENLFLLDGRFSRETFWVLYLGCAVALVLAPLLSSILFWPYVAALTWISFAAGVKRFHDRDKNGWWILVSFIPVIGTFWMLIECGLLEGDRTPNNYGEKALSPKELLQ